MLRSIWTRLFKEPWIMGIVLFILLSILRGYGILSGDKSNYSLVMIGFVIMWSIPFISLTKNGRHQIGIRKPKNIQWILLSPLIGIISALLMFLIGFLLYQNSSDNWYITVGNTYITDPNMLQMPRFKLFIMFTIPAMTFSPIGEELFFRGVIYESIKIKWNLRTAVIVNSALFGLVHILHHGISNQSGSLKVFWLSGVIWVVLIILCGSLFTLIREKTGSIWPAMIAHAFFNLAMNITIFFILL